MKIKNGNMVGVIIIEKVSEVGVSDRMSRRNVSEEYGRRACVYLVVVYV